MEYLFEFVTKPEHVIIVFVVGFVSWITLSAIIDRSQEK